jgi:hypothetical protein
MRRWIDQLSFRARMAIIILVWVIVIFAMAKIDLTIVFEAAASASWW